MQGEVGEGGAEEGRTLIMTPESRKTKGGNERDLCENSGILNEMSSR